MTVLSDIIEISVKQMEEKLSGREDAFAGVKVEMAGSVKYGTKVGKRDEFNIDVLIKLHFDTLNVALTIEKSSYLYDSDMIQ